MRELKFRAWSNEYDHYCSVLQYDTDFGWEGILESEFEYQTDPEPVIEQYTGLKDKNGKEIYEGDIVERRKLISAREMAVPGWGKDYTEIRRAAVVYEHGMFYGRSITAGIDTEYPWNELEVDFEVIGNIHENPELLEGKK